ncbi:MULTISPECIES: hypothetical protein [Pseudomonas syringae group]|uniref:Uncharacterized protein n=4 Tax=Pseudomonas syringae group TaxID=136849 RepID=A0A2K4WTF8_PSESX|nr:MULTISPECIES: hypothetical protein [Pseudomonas syringae group]AVB15346.1 hypothetical protein BKM19_018585 [Pseudomonas amygdali pv. morsprunorum]KPX24841.1 Uncharacterized protein ALO71_00822 [Pseudomonas amygdali pv. dendropanacis]KWS55049.1 hypothetical protein AL056_05405 [Pseudomonas amygdali pv. morsprunorum]KWS58141.1 hypothetical protein AL054_13930 [Pseudomonas amygdali pv. morsprunorum]KWS85771.1 hypothetical protein AL051_02005 [Pseudomonas amygdali pv. dendropanacis]
MNISQLRLGTSTIPLLKNGGQIEPVKLVHHVQTQFEDILFSAKKAAEEAMPEREVSPIADYKFLQQAELSISRYEDSVGIQAADILTGFFVRYPQDRIVYNVEPATLCFSATGS